MNIYAAPLQGYTERFFREAHREAIGGIDEYVMPFLRLEKGELRQKDCRELSPLEPLTIPQVLVKEPAELKVLMKAVLDAGYGQVDINLGCPFPKVAQHGYGAGIWKHPEDVRRLLKALEEYPEVSFSLKIRLGQDDRNESLSLLPELNGAPLRRIVLHPRLGCQQYKGALDMDGFQAFVEGCRHHVVFNGEIRTREDAQGLEAMMMGRGLLANPLLPLEIREGAEIGGERQRQLLALYHEKLLANLLAQEQPLPKLKTVWDYFLPDADSRLRKKLLKSRTLDEYKDIAAQIFSV